MDVGFYFIVTCLRCCSYLHNERNSSFLLGLAHLEQKVPLLLLLRTELDLFAWLCSGEVGLCCCCCCCFVSGSICVYYGGHISFSQSVRDSVDLQVQRASSSGTDSFLCHIVQTKLNCEYLRDMFHIFSLLSRDKRHWRQRKLNIFNGEKEKKKSLVWL